MRRGNHPRPADGWRWLLSDADKTTPKPADGRGVDDLPSIVSPAGPMPQWFISGVSVSDPAWGGLLWEISEAV